ncbi:MAG: nucleotidyltransferase domain-containing protein [Proteobacteria bacterium]|nr:nucleotidyltransferase domain-containing protein [Pseudomonadota bacterium]
METVRISPEELFIIKSAFKKHFSNTDHLWIFGSRTDPKRRGGDLDFYIETPEIDFELILKRKSAFVSELWDKIGEQKIDVVINLINKPADLAIYKEAQKTGVKLV